MIPMPVRAQNGLEPNPSAIRVVPLRDVHKRRSDGVGVARVDHHCGQAAFRVCVRWGWRRRPGRGVDDDVGVVVPEQRDGMDEACAPILAGKEQLRADVRVPAVVAPPQAMHLHHAGEAHVELADGQGVRVLYDGAEPGHRLAQKPSEERFGDLQDAQDDADEQHPHQEEDRPQQVEEIAQQSAATPLVLGRKPWRKLPGTPTCQSSHRPERRENRGEVRGRTRLIA
mmetsp:Transcript_92655/g.267573  ORF Transcript_92655/g.267573 Transcript_92655/m.267573 type:complete len:227 (-) Transcript_92655:2-682(-)